MSWRRQQRQGYNPQWFKVFKLIKTLPYQDFIFMEELGQYVILPGSVEHMIVMTTRLMNLWYT